MTRPYRRAALGGTFDRFHVGHQLLIDTAFRLAEEVGIGITTRRYLRDHPKPTVRRIQPFRVRRAVVEEWVRRRYPGRRWWVSPLEDTVGSSFDARVDLLVASKETERGAKAVNAARRARGIRPLAFRFVPAVWGADHLPVSSRRIRAGRIDSSGRRSRALEIGMAGGTADDRAQVERALRLCFSRRVPVRLRTVASTAPRTLPRSGLRGLAERRAELGLTRREFGIGLARTMPRGQRPGWLVVSVRSAEDAVTATGRDVPGALERLLEHAWVRRLEAHRRKVLASSDAPRPSWRRTSA